MKDRGSIHLNFIPPQWYLSIHSVYSLFISQIFLWVIPQTKNRHEEQREIPKYMIEKNSDEKSIPREQPNQNKNENCRPGFIKPVHER